MSYPRDASSFARESPIPLDAPVTRANFSDITELRNAFRYVVTGSRMQVKFTGFGDKNRSMKILSYSANSRSCWAPECSHCWS